jgi:hypothetical protein
MLGSGFGSGLLSFLASLVHKNDTATLYMVVSVLFNISQLVGLPSLRVALSEGIRLKGAWIGLPFYISAGVYFLSMVVMWSVNAPERVVNEEEED